MEINRDVKLEDRVISSLKIMNIQAVPNLDMLQSAVPRKREGKRRLKH